LGKGRWRPRWPQGTTSAWAAQLAPERCQELLVSPTEEKKFLLSLNFVDGYG